MKLDEMANLFSDENDERGKFDRVKNRLHKRPDLHAFLLLDQLVPGNFDMVSAAAHDEIFLDTNPEKLAEVAAREQVIDLIRCGVRYSDDSLCMFV
jgi:hypothetical protein